MITDPVIDAVRSTRMLARGQTVLVAVSGGADSMALLSALRALADTLGIDLHAAQFDHGLRPDSERDRDLVVTYCTRHEVTLHLGRGDVRARSRVRRESIEAAARHLRYAFLEATADAIGADRVATAHTLSDQAETVLMRIGRGAGVRGLAGILTERGRVVRPLLGVTRDDTVAHCRRHGIPYVDDPTNADRRFERNRVRHEVLPRLRVTAPGIDRHLADLAGDAARVLDDIRSLTQPRLASGFRGERSGVWVLDTQALHGLDEASLQVLFADLVYDRLGCSEELSRAHFRALRALCAPETHSGRAASLPGLTVRREHDALVFFSGPASRRSVPATEIAVPGRTRVDSGTVVTSRLVKSRSGDESVGSGAGAVAYFANEDVQPPLVVRSPQPGDRMPPRGMGGRRKKISDILIDRKIPRRHRDGALVIEDRAGILWLVGESIDERSERAAGNVARDLVRIDIQRVKTDTLRNGSKP